MSGVELHTDYLKRRMGADYVACDVLCHDVAERNRLVVLSTVQNQSDQTLKAPQAVAYAFLNPTDWTTEVRAVDAELAAGGLMGETFRAHDMTVRQNCLFRKRLPLASPFLAELYEVEADAGSEVECYEFWADTVLYAVVVEMKNPDRNHMPERPHLGLASVLRSRGVSREDLIAWLDDPSGIDPSHFGSVAVARHMGRRLGAALHVKGRKLFDEKYGG